MGVVIPVGFGQVALDHYNIIDPEPMTTLFGFDYTATNPDPAGIADTFFTFLTGTNGMLQLSTVSNGVTIGPFRVAVNTAGGLLSGVGTLFGVGTSVVPPLPNNCSWLLQKRTARGGRKGRGRSYLPPTQLSETDVSSIGVLGIATRNAFQTRVNLFRTDALANQLGLVLLHSGAEAPDEITSLVVDTRIATQRTRMRP